MIERKLFDRIEFERMEDSEGNCEMFFLAPIEMLPWDCEEASMMGIHISTPSSDIDSAAATVYIGAYVFDKSKEDFDCAAWHKTDGFFTHDEIDALIEMALRENVMDAVEVGMLSVPTGTVDITDPCYKKSVWCRMNDVEIRPGTYKCTAYMGDMGNWGERCRIAEILHTDEYDFNDLTTEVIGNIGVDAGMAGFFAGGKPDFEEDWFEFCDSLGNADYWLTHLKDFDPTKEPNAFWTSSGYGDGGYDVIAGKRDGEIVGLRIVFI